jgi:predicted HicB family RNase H-like nuclease
MNWLIKGSLRGWNSTTIDHIFVGRLIGIDDVVSFHAESAADLRDAFHEAVDDFIETRAAVGRKIDR